MESSQLKDTSLTTTTTKKDIIIITRLSQLYILTLIYNSHWSLYPDHQVLKSLHNKDYGYGSLLCIDMDTEERANRLMNLLQISSHFGLMAVSLGYYETLMSCSGSSTSSELNAAEKEHARISPGLFRVSVGTLEHRWSQLEEALLKMQDLDNRVSEI